MGPPSLRLKGTVLFSAGVWPLLAVAGLRAALFSERQRPFHNLNRVPANANIYDAVSLLFSADKNVTRSFDLDSLQDVNCFAWPHNSVAHHPCRRATRG